MARGTRTKIAVGIYQDRCGYAAVVKVNGKPTEKRFPAETPLETLTDWRATMQRRLTAETPSTIRGTLADDMRLYLASVTSMPSYEARRADSEAWLPPFGQRDRRSILPRELTTQLNDWAAEGYAASTLNHRRQALIACYEFMDPDGPNPVSGTTPRRPLPLEARALPWDDVLELTAAFPQTKSSALLCVMTHTGYPPARIQRLTPADVDWDTSAVFLAGRRKGHGTKSERARVTVDGLAALRDYFRYFPEGGGVSKNSWIVAFRQGVAAVNRQRALMGRQPLPDGLRPYDLRHSFGTKLYEATGDLHAVARTLGCSMETAERYTMGAVPVQIDKAITAMNAVNVRMAPHPREVALSRDERMARDEPVSTLVIDQRPEGKGGTSECHPKQADGTRTGSHEHAKHGANPQAQKSVPSAPIGRLVPRKRPENA